MKLRTEMQNGCVHANGYCVDEDAVDVRQAERLVHDTAAAHALMQAMKEFNHAGHTRYQNPIYAAMCRADTIMREWGFDSAEVE